MQYSYIPLLKKAEKLPLGFIFKSIILVSILSYLFFEIQKEQYLLNNLFYNFKSIFSTKPLIIISIPLLLVPLNLGAEALKWQILSHKIVKQNFIQSFTGVLSGLSLGFMTPQSIGDYAGRIWHIKNDRRSELIGAVFLGSFIQSLVSITFGIWGAAVYFKNSTINFYSSLNNTVIFLFILSLIIIAFLYLLNSFKAFIPNIIISFYQKYLSIITTYSINDLIKIGGLSLIRYVIFLVQFLIILVLFDVNLPIQVLVAGVSWVFFAKTIIPAFNFLSDIGVREFSALLFFNHYHIDVSTIILSSLFIWLINILLPTIVGSFLMFRMRVFRK